MFNRKEKLRIRERINLRNFISGNQESNDATEFVSRSIVILGVIAHAYTRCAPIPIIGLE